MSTNGSTVFEEQSRHVLRNNARRCLRRTTMLRITSDVNWTAMPPDEFFFLTMLRQHSQYDIRLGFNFMVLVRVRVRVRFGLG